MMSSRGVQRVGCQNRFLLLLSKKRGDYLYMVKSEGPIPRHRGTSDDRLEGSRLQGYDRVSSLEVRRRPTLGQC